MSTRNNTAHHSPRRIPVPPARRRRLLVGTATALALTLGTTACGNEKDDAEAQESRAFSTRIGISVPNVDSDFYRDLLTGARTEAQAQGARLSVRNADNDVNQQDSDLDQLSTEDVGSVVFSPVDESSSPGLRPLTQAGVPTVGIVRAGGEFDATSLITSDRAPTGRLAADALADALDEKGSVVVLHGGPENAAAKGEHAGFKDRLSKYKNVKVLADKSADLDQKTARATMTELLATYPKLDGVFAENDAMALGAAQAIADWGASDVSVVTPEGTAAALKAVRSGKLHATIAQQPKEIGRVAVRNALRAAKGEKVDERIQVPMRVINRGNIETLG